MVRGLAAPIARLFRLTLEDPYASVRTEKTTEIHLDRLNDSDSIRINDNCSE